MKKFLGLMFLFGAQILRAQESGNDFQYWSSLNKDLYSNRSMQISFYFETRARDDATDAFGYFFGPRLRYKFNSIFSVGTAAKVGHFKSGGHFNRFQRYEGELYLDFKIFSKVRYRNRYRLEYFNREQGENSKRHRYRIQFSLPAPNVKLIRGFFFGNELFYDERINDFSSNRLVPLGINLNLVSKSTLTIFYMVEFLNSPSRENHIFATSVVF